MFTIVVTGGVATGKSTVVSDLAARFGDSCRVFDCDAEVAELLTSPGIHARLRQHFGDSVFSPGGDLNRRSLRELVFRDSSERRKLESILHPSVLCRCREEQEAAKAGTPPAGWFVADVPLLYEVDFPICYDLAISTGCASQTQLNRLQLRASMDAESAQNIINAQLPQNEKFARADMVIWTEGSVASTRRQIDAGLSLL